MPTKFLHLLLFFGIDLVCTAMSTSAASPLIHYVSQPTPRATAILDTRASAKCESASLKGAKCLPVSDFLGPHNRLANFSGMLWLLGTAGLTGSEIVLVIGAHRRDVEFMAGLLYLAGQRDVIVLTTPVAKLTQDLLAPGTPRAKTREKVYQAAMRAKQIVLRSELAAIIRQNRAPIIFDGRTELEYWGKTVRASRGGHLPGAQHLPLTSLANQSAKLPIDLPSLDTPAVIYGHDSYDGLIYLARFAALGLRPKLYLEGWAGWASDGALPADSVTYPRRTNTAGPTLSATKPEAPTALPLIVLLVVSGIGMFAAGIFANRLLTRAPNPKKRT